MRLLSATVRHYRLHRELSLDFDPALTLIGGPNESGKSTFAEAVHRAFFLSARGNAAVHQRMRSQLHGGTPEVEVRFAIGRDVYRVHKRFAGPKGTTHLHHEGHPTVTGEEAETRLAELLCVPADRSTNKCDSVWAHVWITQGRAWLDPLPQANDQRDALVARLQSHGGGALALSATDRAVAATLLERHDALFTTGAKERANSPLAVARADAAQATADHAAALAALAARAAAIEQFESAERTLAETGPALIQLRAELQALQARQDQLARLRQREQADAQRAQLAVQEHDRLTTAATALLGVQREHEHAIARLAPGEHTLAQLEQIAREAREALAAVDTESAAAVDAVRTAAQLHDLAAAHVRRLEASATQADLAVRATEIAREQTTLTELRRQLALLPPLEPADLRRLQQLDQAAATTRAALTGIATGLRLEHAPGPVQVGAQPLLPGAECIITEDTLLTFADGTALRIRPGGGRSLADARRTADTAAADLRAALDQLALADLAAAGDALAARQSLQQQIDLLTARLRSLKADALPADLAAARDALAAAQAEVERRRAAVTTPPADPADLVAARQALQDATMHRATVDETQQRTLARRQTATRAHDTASARLDEHNRRLLAERNALRDLATRRQLLEEQQGDEATRRQRLVEAVGTRDTAAAALAATRAAIAQLQPETLAADLARLTRALDQQESRRRDADTQREVARAQLQHDGGHDPATAVALAAARRAAAEQRLAAEQHRADALQLLHRAFDDARRALAERFSRPLAEKVEGYLATLFGPGTGARLRLENNAFTGLELSRPGQVNGTAIEFNELSGGTREQLAAALRLAMAEVLAADFGGCLPIVFDDAFAYADPQRVQTLQRMLDRAGSRGLQVIVLTCTPGDYITLGARTHLLSPPAAAAPSLPAAAPPRAEPGVPSSDDDASALIHVDDTQTAAFLAALRSSGGSAGNSALRAQLDWDESTYTAVRDLLIDRGQLTRGRGRGGSVSLVD